MHVMIEMLERRSLLIKQQHPRGIIVEPPGLHLDGLNSLLYSGLKPPIIIAHMCMTFSSCKRKEIEISS